MSFRDAKILCVTLRKVCGIKKLSDIFGVDVNTLIYGEKPFSERKEIIEKHAPKLICLLVTGILLYAAAAFTSLYGMYSEWSLQIIPVNLLLPIWFLIFGWMLMDMICKSWDLQLFKGKYVSVFRKILWIVLVLYFILILWLDGYTIIEFIKELKEPSDSLYSIIMPADDPRANLMLFRSVLFQFSYIGMKPFYFILPGLLLRASKVQKENR